MTEEIPPTLLLGSLSIFTALTVWNIRKYMKYKTSPIALLLSVLVLLWLMLLYLNEISYAALVFILTGLIAIIALPHTWKDWVKVLRSKGVNPEEKIKLRDYFSWNLFIKLGYRFGVNKAAFLYALNYSAVFALCYSGFGILLSMKYSYIAAFVAAVIIFPINYILARKTIEGLISGQVEG